MCSARHWGDGLVAQPTATTATDDYRGAGCADVGGQITAALNANCRTGSHYNVATEDRSGVGRRNVENPDRSMVGIATAEVHGDQTRVMPKAPAEGARVDDVTISVPFLGVDGGTTVLL